MTRFNQVLALTLRTLSLLLALSVSIGSSNLCDAADYYVRMSGNDKFDGSSPKLAFATVGQAIASCKSSSDRIFIGAGRYTVNSVRPMANKNASLEIIGDTQGVFTGDKGSVEISGPPNAWSIYLYDGAYVSISGLTFVGQSTGTNYGLVTIRMSKGVQISDCNFQQTHYGFYSINSPTTVSNCQFSEVTQLALQQYESSLEVQNCRFDNCRYAVYATGASLAVNKSQFNSDARSWRLAVYGNRCSADISNLEIQGYSTAVQCENSSKAVIQDCQIQGITNWGVYATGSGLSATGINIANRGRIGNGLCLYESSGKSSNLAHCSLRGLNVGIYSYGEPCDYDKVLIEDCSYGFYSIGARSTVLSGKQGLNFNNNYVAILASNAADKPGTLELNRMNLSNNDYAVYSNNVSFTANHCNFSANSRAVYVLRAPNATLFQCEFLRNNARNNWSHWGARIESFQTTVKNCKFERNDSGLVLVNLSDQEPQLSQVTIQDNKNYGLLVYNGSISISKKSQLVISGSTYGLMTQNSNCKIRGWNAPVSSTYPVYVYRGSLEMENTEIDSGTVGVYAVQTTSSRVTNCAFSKVTHIAYYDIQSQDSLVDNCQFTELTNGVYMHTASSAQVANSSFSSLTGSAIIGVSSERLVIQSCVIDQCKNFGVYCPLTNAPAEAISVSDSQVSNCTYGMMFAGVPINDENLRNVQFMNNQYGLMVQRAPMTLTEKSSLQLQGNTYALVNYWGEINLDGVKLSDNQISLYGHYSSVSATNSYFASTNYGCIFYAGVINLDNLTFEGGNYGIYFHNHAQPKCSLTVSRTNVNAARNVGIYSIVSAEPCLTRVSEVTINGAAYGLYCSGGNVTTDQVNIVRSSAIGLYAINSNSQHSRLRVTNCTSWGVYGNQGQMMLDATEVSGGNGILLNTATSRVASSLIAGTNYGVYAQLATGKYEIVNCTLADIRFEGVYATAGTVSLINSIVQAGRFGLRALPGRSTIISDFNIVRGSNRSYLNVAVGPNDIDKQPVFVNASNRDYRLNSGSPAINAGQNLSHLVSTDLDGNARGSFGGFEIGAYEYMNPSGSVKIVQWQETAQ